MNENELENQCNDLLNKYSKRSDKSYPIYEHDKTSAEFNLNFSLNFKQRILFKKYLLAEEKSNQETLKDIIKFIIKYYELKNKK